MKIFKKKDSDDSNHSSLKTPSSLPDTFIEKYGFDDIEPVKKKSVVESKDPQKIPDDIEDDKDFFDQIQEHSSVEFIKEASEETKESAQDASSVDDKQENIVIEVASKKKDVESSSKKDLSQDEAEKSKKVEIDIEQKEDKVARAPSFFAELEKLLSESKKYSHASFSENLVDMMKKFHNARNTGEHFFFHRQELEDALYKKMLRLKEIEKEWIIRAKEFNAAKELLEEKEREINKVSEDLKKLIKKADRYKLFSLEVPHDKAFHLINRKILTSINDLIYELEVMSDDVFHHHVNGRQNDFSLWISHVYKEKKLSEDLRKCSTKKEFLDVLKNY